MNSREDKMKQFGFTRSIEDVKLKINEIMISPPTKTQNNNYEYMIGCSYGKNNLFEQLRLGSYDNILLQKNSKICTYDDSKIEKFIRIRNCGVPDPIKIHRENDGNKILYIIDEECIIGFNDNIQITTNGPIDDRYIWFNDVKMTCTNTKEQEEEDKKRAETFRFKDKNVNR